MIVPILIVLLWTPYVVTRLLRALHARTPHPHDARAEPPTRARSDEANLGRPAWTALDDHQLTRLLTDSARRPTND